MADTSGWFRKTRQLDLSARLSVYLLSGTTAAFVLLTATLVLAVVVVRHSELAQPAFRGEARIAQAHVTERIQSHWGVGGYCTYIYSVRRNHYQGHVYGDAKWVSEQPEVFGVQYLVSNPSVSRMMGQRRALFPANWLVVSGALVLLGLVAVRAAVGRGRITIDLLENGTAVQATVCESPETTDSGDVVLEFDTEQFGKEKTEATVPASIDDPMVNDTLVLIYDPNKMSRRILPAYHPAMLTCDTDGTISASSFRPLRAPVTVGLLISVISVLSSTGMLDPMAGQPLGQVIYGKPGEQPSGSPPLARTLMGGKAVTSYSIYSSDQQALEAAVSGQDIDAVASFLEKKVDVNAATSRGDSVLHLAADAGSPRIIAMLVKHGAKVDAVDPQGETPLMRAVRSGKLEAVEQLIKCGAGVNARSSEGLTALHLAAYQGRAVIAETLLSGGADPNAACADGQTPLHVAATEGEARVSRILIRYHAKLNAQAESGRTPLACAAELGRDEVVQTLIEAGADKELRCHDGTPLHEALGSLHGSTAELLVKAGADVNARDNVGGLPLCRAAEMGATGLVKLMIAKGARLDALGFGAKSALHEAVHAGRALVVSALLEAGANPNVTDEEGNTPLHTAVLEGRDDMARLLVSNGARADQKNRHRVSPLDLARRKGDEAVMRAIARGHH